MEYNTGQAIEILERTPVVLENLLGGKLSAEWVKNNEGDETWSPFDIVGHLVHGERTDWPQRILKITDPNQDNKFEPFDRFAQFRDSIGKSMPQLLDEFAELREKNLELLKELNITDTDLDKKGIHPSFGEVTLRELLSTWVAHDLNHLAQIARVMAKQYIDEVGPWKEYLRILKS